MAWLRCPVRCCCKCVLHSCAGLCPLLRIPCVWLALLQANMCVAALFFGNNPANVDQVWFVDMLGLCLGLFAFVFSYLCVTHLLLLSG